MGQNVKIIQSTFNKGELSPRLRGRVDNKYYYNAFDYGLNMLPFPEGAIIYRPGTVHVSEVKTSAKVTIIRPFQFSTIQNYIIEFGDQYVRFYRNRGQVESSPGVAYELATPYLEADLRELYFFQSADVMYILHPDYQPRKLTRTSDTSWTITVIDFIDGPYETINSSATTFARSGTTITASTNTFVAGDVGRQIRMKNGAAWESMEITVYTNATTVTVDISGTISANTDWRLGVFGGAGGWPAAGTIYEERLILGRTVNLPSTVWGSKTGAFETFSPSNLDDGVVEDDSGFSFTIADDKVNAINGFSSGRTLLIFTTGAEHSLTGGTSSGYAPVTPSNVTIKREANYGSKANIRQFRIGNAVLYASQSGRKLREIYYEFGIDSYISRDTTMFNEHLLRPGIVDLDYSQEPDPYVWLCNENGELISFLYERLQEIEGWTRHLPGGDDVLVKSVAVIPRPADENDDVWLLVSRTVNGATVQYIEYISEIYEDVSAPISGVDTRLYAKFLDSCITYDGYLDSTLTPAATTGTGITFTAGSSVFVAGDVGKQIRVGAGRATITVYNSATSVDADITVNLASTDVAAAGSWCLAAKVFSGLSHLEGQTIGLQVDGAITDDEVVSSGAVTISNFACVVHAGLKYNGTLRLLPPEAPQFGTIQGREKSIARAHVYVTDTYGLSVTGSDVDVTDTVKFLKFPIDTGTAPALKTGLITFHPPSGYNRGDALEFQHNLALPLTINYIVQDLDVNA